ncbi:MAG: hypothetical protein ACREXP_27390, partial [Steroidobacteraceae bacterium]
MARALLFAVVVAAGIAAAVLIGRNSPLFALAPAVMALAALGLPVRGAVIAGFIAATCVVAKTVVAAYGFDPLHASEWLRVGAFALTWAAILAIIAQVRRRSRVVAAVLVLAAALAFILIA